MLRIIAVIAILNLISCVGIKEQYGFEIRNENEKIQIGKTSKLEVMDLLGSPTFIDNINEDKWIYIELHSIQKGILTPKINKYKTLTIIFNNDIVINKKYEIEDNPKEIILSTDKTDSMGDDKHILHNLFNNVGKYNKRK